MFHDDISSMFEWIYVSNIKYGRNGAADDMAAARKAFIKAST